MPAATDWPNQQCSTSRVAAAKLISYRVALMFHHVMHHLRRHFFFFFAPTMIMANNLARLILCMAFFTGPVFTQMLAARHMDTYKFEW
jgi:hypothetical protein